MSPFDQTQAATDLLLDTLRAAGELLTDAEALARERVAALHQHLSTVELARMQQILQQATHELATTLALTAQELAILQQRAALRARHPMFNVAQCDALLTQGWSLALGQQLQRELPGAGLRDIAVAAQRLQADAASLPPAVRSGA
ncbi:MAG: hypothetical protein U1F26_09655 [Lysobacterales bacterium]